MEIFDGGITTDDRGTLRFVNEVDFSKVKRFYTVENHAKGFVRAWHGHKKEAKYVYVTKGAIILCAVGMNGGGASRNVLSSTNPQIALIYPGYYNGFKTLTDDTQVMFFSTSTLEESKDDDYRKDADTWEMFEVVSR